MEITSTQAGTIQRYFCIGLAKKQKTMKSLQKATSS